MGNSTSKGKSKIEQETFDKAIIDLESVKTSLSPKVNTVRTRNAKLVSAWTGSGGDAFMKASFSLESDLAYILGTMDNFLNGLNGTKTSVENIDAEMEGILGVQ